jgi:hypothetical protein
MKTQDLINQELVAAGFKTVPGANVNKEIQSLPKILRDGETIKFAAIGTFGKGGNGLCVTTSERVLFVFVGSLSGLSVEEFPLNAITSTQVNSSWLTSDLIITAAGNTTKFMITEKSITQNLRNAIVNAQAEFAKPKAEAIDIVSQLEKLAALKEKGILTDEEFQEQKKKLLS